MIKQAGMDFTSLPWKVLNYTQETATLYIQLLFPNPKNVSISREMDIVRIQFLQSKFFVSEPDKRWVSTRNFLEYYIPQ